MSLEAARQMGRCAGLSCDIERERSAEARRTFGFWKTDGDGVAALERHDIGRLV